MKKVYPKLSLTGIVLFACIAANAQNIKPLIADMDIVTHNSSNPSNYIDDSAQSSFAVLNGIYYFIASADDAHAGYLWRSDGTAGGTYLVTNKISGAQNIDTLNGTLYISSRVMGVFVSNGTDAGTHKIPGATTAGGSTNFVNFQGHVFYGSSQQLYKTDGTQGGTVVVDQVNALGRFRFLPLKNILLFSAIEANGYISSHYFDGVGTDTSQLGYEPNSTLLGDSVYYSGNGTLYTYPQNILDASSPGTPALNPNNAVIGAGFITRPFAVINGVLYFAATTPATGTELYKYEPLSGAGITLVKDIVPGAGGANVDNKNMLVIGNSLYFTATGSDSSTQLWKTDGTEAGTVLVKVMDAGSRTTFSDLTNVNGTLFFNFNSPANGAELWRSDGTDAGTVLVKDIYAGPRGSNPDFITTANGSTILFAAGDGSPAHGLELWASDGTGAGTTLLKDINVTVIHTARVTMQDYTVLNNFIVFNGTDTTNGSELWVTDGTPEGTGLLKDIVPGIGSSNPHSFQVVNGTTAYFIADSAAGSGRNLWKTDGTAAGTVLVKRFSDGGPNLVQLNAAVNNLVFFMVSYPSGPQLNALWRSDGTDTGTYLVRGLNFDYSLPFLFAGGTKSFFYSDQFSYISTAGDNDGHTAYLDSVWQTDGTPAGTVLVQTFTYPEGDLFVTAGNTLVFSPGGGLALVNSSGFKLPGYGYQAGSGGVVNNTVYASIYTFANPPVYFLGKIDSNGNVAQVHPYTTGTPAFTNAVGLPDGKIYFENSTSIGVLDQADTTLTYITKSYNIGKLVNGYGKLYFISNPAITPSIGVSDGTDAGTNLLTDTILPFVNGNIANLMVTNHHLIFPESISYPPGEVQLYALQISDALPVKSLSFTGKLVNGNGVLNWSTASEQNSKYFGVERSTDGVQFSAVGVVQAAGFATTKNNYAFTDYNAIKLGSANLYYRLKQVDKDGKYVYSNVVLLRVLVDFAAFVSPVPITGQLNVSITSAKTQTVQLTVTNMGGKVLLTSQKAIGMGSTSLQYNTANWAAGVYLVELTQADGTRQTVKIVKQ